MRHHIKLFYCIFLFGCASSKQTSKIFRDNIPVVPFCDLANHKGQLIYLEANYSGVEEYWSIKSTNKKCTEKLRVQLEFKGLPFSIPTEYQKNFDSVYNSYWNSYLFMKCIGVFDDSSKTGYGHLGSNNARFTISEVIDLKVVKKKVKHKFL